MSPCTCIAKDHDHEVARCERQGTYMGGVCHDCRYWVMTKERDENLAKRDNL